MKTTFHLTDLERGLDMPRQMIERALCKARIACRPNGDIPVLPAAYSEKARQFLTHLIDLTKSVPR